MKQTIEYVVVCCIGLAFSILVTFKVIRSFFSTGFKSICGVKYRSRPKILSDPRFGTSSYLHLKDITMHYVEKGDQRKPLVLLLHGFPEFWFSWRHQLDSELTKNFRVVAIDMRGYGGTDKPRGAENYKMEKLIEDVRQAIHALGYDTCHLVGHDWGGAVAWAFAIAHPAMVTKLAVLNCPHPAAFMKNIRSSWAQFMKSWYMFFFQLPCYPEWMVSRQDLVSMDVTMKGVLNQQELDAFKYTFNSACAFNGPINYYRAAFRYSDRATRTGRSASKLEVPSLLIFGAGDKYISEKTARMSGQYCKQLDFQLVPGASHWVQQDAPDQVNRLLARFFAKTEEEEDEDSGDDGGAALREGLKDLKDLSDAARDDAGRLLGDLVGSSGSS